VLWLIKKSKLITNNEIAEKSFQRIDKVNQIIDDLVNSGAVIKTENGELRVQEIIATLQTKVVAIEAKLSRWSQAFNQAQRYQEFADKVIVAIDADKTPKRKSILEKFKEQNIGLCAISPNSLEWLVYPRYKFVESFEKEYLVTSALSPSTHTLWERR
jgi:polyhydroxyalkanoate synthesis regulator phasin